MQAERALAISRRRDGLADATLRTHRRNLERRLDRLLSSDPPTPAGRRLRKGIAKCRASLFVFVARRDVPPTNNACERALRPSVIFRKVTGGFRSAWGAGAYAAVASLIATGALAGTRPLDAIRTCLEGRSVLTTA